MSHSEQEQFQDWLEGLSTARRDFFSLLFGNRKHDEDAPILEALDALDLPMSLPGETLHQTRHGDGTYFYDPNGFPFAGDPVDQAEAFEALYEADENHFRTSLSAVDGRSVWVSTVYLGADHGTIFSRETWAPAVWETMIATDFSFSSWQMRYHTKAAAQTAHSLIIGCLLSLGLTLDEEPG
jgi:hypothetical protein